MNVDENADPVFDGVHIHIAGGRRGEFNSRYGQPGVIWRGPGDVPPFTTNALLERQREARRDAQGGRHEQRGRILARRCMARAR